MRIKEKHRDESRPVSSSQGYGNTEINQGMESGDIYPTLSANLKLAGSV